MAPGRSSRRSSRRRAVPAFGLSFLDAMTCGFGAVILFFMIIQSSVGVREDRLTRDLSAEVDRLEVEVIEGQRRLARLRNALADAEERRLVARGLAARMIERLREIERELATYDRETLARREHVDELMADLRSLEEDTRRLAASVPDDETPGDRLRAFEGEGHRQYLTGLELDGRRTLILVDTSASMLDETVVGAVRRRNLPPGQRVRSAKWRQGVATVDWLTAQLPRSGRFQLYAFAEDARPLLEGSAGAWLDPGDRASLEGAVAALRRAVPAGGTNLHAAFAAASALNPPPDSLVLVTDGLPTRGPREPRRSTVSPERRLELFEGATRELPAGVPVHVLLLPMEGDPMAAPAFWKLAVASRGSFVTPSEDWP